MPGVLQPPIGVVPPMEHLFAALELVAYRYPDETTLAVIGELAGQVVAAAMAGDYQAHYHASCAAAGYVQRRLAEART